MRAMKMCAMTAAFKVRRSRQRCNVHPSGYKPGNFLIDCGLASSKYDFDDSINSEYKSCGGVHTVGTRQ